MKLSSISFVVLICVAMFGFSSCDEVDELTKFDLNYNSSITIPSTIVVETPLVISSPDITTNAETRFESNNTRKDLVESVKLTRMVLNVETPDGEDFSFLKSIKLSISADGLPTKEIASKTDIVGTETSLELIIDDVELKDYLLKNSFSLESSVTTDEVVNQEYKIGVSTTFRVDAKILGL